jgi:hypothetical protein
MTDGRLAFFDENLVLCQLLTLISPKDSEHDQIDGVLDFESLDADDPFMELNREMKILLKVKTKSGQIQVYCQHSGSMENGLITPSIYLSS